MGNMDKRLVVLAMLCMAAGLLFSTITVTAPNGGESWTPGYSYNVTWTATGVTGNVKIELYRFTGILNFVDTINSSISSSAGTYSWRVPLTTPAATNYVVRITSLTNTDDTDLSNNMFSITPAPTVTVTSPNGGENWTIGTTHNISWTSTDLTGVLAIRLVNFSNGGMVTLATVSVPTGSYSWTIGSSTLPGNSYRIRLVCFQVPEVADSSDAYFSISAAPAVNITSPNGGEHWFRGSSYPIQWSAVNVTGSAKIELFRGTNATPTATVVSSTVITNGIQMWSIPTTIPEADDYKIRISSLTNSSVYDMSNDFFTISDFVSNDDPNAVPFATALQGIYPNPFKTKTQIHYSVKTPSTVTLAIYDVKGRLIKHLVHEKKAAGSFTATWDGDDDSGKPLCNGIYYLHMQADDFQSQQKLVLLK